MSESQPLMSCPECDSEYEDFDGIGVRFCPCCGFCQHDHIDDGVCRACGKWELIRFRRYDARKGGEK